MDDWCYNLPQGRLVLQTAAEITVLQPVQVQPVSGTTGVTTCPRSHSSYSLSQGPLVLQPFPGTTEVTTFPRGLSSYTLF